MTADMPPQYQPIAPEDRGLYAKLRANGVAYGAAIIACWDAERERLGLPAIPPRPPSRGLVAYHMPGAARLHQGSRPDGADNQARPDVSSQKTTPPVAARLPAGAFSGGAA